MKVLYLISGTIWGGATISFLTLIKGLREFGIEAIVVMSDRHEEFVQELEKIGVKYYVKSMRFCCYPVTKSLVDKILFCRRIVGVYRNNLNVGKEIENIINAEGVDIIHTNVGPIRIGHNIAKKRSIPHVWHIREYGDLDFCIFEMPSKSYFRKLLHEDYVITITKDLLCYNNLIDSHKAVTIYNGVMSLNDIVYNPHKEKYFLCCSRISPEKGHEDIVETFCRFHKNNPDYKLKILGEGSFKFVDELKSIAIKNDCSESIEFLGFKRDIRNYMSKAKALIVASPAEGFGRMTAEAAFVGCMIIGRNTAGTREIIEETGGLTFNTNDEMLTAMIQCTQMTHVEYERIVLRAQSVAQKLYSNEQYVQSVLDVYKKALKRKNLH